MIKWGAPPDLEFMLLGILKTAGYRDAEGEMIEKDVPTKKVKVPSTQEMIHLGYYIKARELMGFDELFT
jgi:hypothetical protein